MELFKSNDKRRSVLEPLFFWRYLGLAELKKASLYRGTRQGLSLLLNNMRKDGLVNSFTHQLSSRKIYSISALTFRNYAEGPFYLNNENRTHDSIVSTLLFTLNGEERVKDADLFYQNSKKYDGSFGDIVEPDGVFSISNGKQDILRVALEVELNRKGSDKIFLKYSKYQRSGDYDLVIYVFNDSKILEAYLRYYQEFIAENNINSLDQHIVFSYSNKLGDSNINITAFKAINGAGEMIELRSLFL